MGGDIMKPNTKYTAKNIVDDRWVFTSSDEGTYTTEMLRTAFLLDIARLLREIRSDIRSLGNDGIHQVIREHLRLINRRKAREKKKSVLTG